MKYNLGWRSQNHAVQLGLSEYLASITGQMTSRMLWGGLHWLAGERGHYHTQCSTTSQKKTLTHKVALHGEAGISLILRVPEHTVL